MIIDFYYNFSCPHCYIVFQKLLKAQENIGLQNLTINFIPTDQRSDEVESVKKFLTQYNIDENFIFKRGQNLQFANQVMVYVEDKYAWYRKVAEAYFHEYRNITDETVIKSLLPDYSSELIEEIKKIPLAISDIAPTTLKIGDVVICGIKNISFYEFALSCFFNDKRDEEIIAVSVCEGNSCG